MTRKFKSYAKTIKGYAKRGTVKTAKMMNGKRKFIVAGAMIAVTALGAFAIHANRAK